MKAKSIIKLYKLASMIILSCTLCACAQLPKNKSSQYGAKGKEVAVKQHFYLKEARMFKLGDTVTTKSSSLKNSGAVGFEYIIKNVQLFETPLQAGIKQEQLREAEYYSSLDQPQMKSIEEIQKNNMLIIEVTLTNINEENDPNITFLTLVEEANDKELFLLGYPSYFSETISTDAFDSKFYHFNLLKGQSMTAKIGWYVDSKTINEKCLYLASNFGGEGEDVSYSRIIF